MAHHTTLVCHSTDNTISPGWYGVDHPFQLYSKIDKNVSTAKLGGDQKSKIHYISHNLYMYIFGKFMKNGAFFVFMATSESLTALS